MRPHALGDPAMEEHAALGGDIAAEQDLLRLEPHGEQQPSAERRDRHSARSRVRGRDVVVALRIVELLGGRADEDVVVRQFAEVEAGLRDGQVDGRRRRQILDVEHRQAFLRHLIDWSERQAVAVREGQALVDPGAIGQAANSARAPTASPGAVRRRSCSDRCPRTRSRSRCGSPGAGRRYRAAADDPTGGCSERRGVAHDVVARQQRVAGQLPLLDVLEARTPRAWRQCCIPCTASRAPVHSAPR